MTTSWKAGVAKTVITPTEPMWLAGWAVRTEPARGTLTDLFAKALAIEDSHGGRFVLVTADLIAISREIGDTVTEQAHRRWNLPRERLMFCASHTHGGPEIRPDKAQFFHIPPEYARKIEPYVSWLTDRLVETVGAALADPKPTRLLVRRTMETFAHNRRGAEAVDHDVPVLEVTGCGGYLPKAVVFGYACHNLTMPPDDYRYSGDYAGFAQRALEGHNTAALFVAGAGADQNPEPRGTLALTQSHGRKLSFSICRCLEEHPVIEITRPLRPTYGEVPLAFQPAPTRHVLEADRASDDPLRRAKAEHLLGRLDRGEAMPTSFPCPIQVVRFGDQLLLIAIGGEPVVDYAHELKRRYGGGGRVVWVAGYANDMFGYVPSAAVLREGGYEGTRSLLWSALPAPFAENTEQRLLDGIDRLVQQVGWTYGGR
jgi:hypothetical protein